MNTYLQISALLFLTIILIEYFRKKKINSLENIIFRLIIITMMVTVVLDILSTIFALYFPITKWTGYLIKVFLWGLVTWVYLFSYYVYCITSNKSAGPIEFKDHPHKQFFIKRFISTVIAIIALDIWMLLVPLDKTWYYDGPAMIVAYVATGVGIVTWMIRLFQVRKNLKQTKYIPIYIFFTVGVATITLQFVFPELSLVTPVAAYITAVMFFTMENPDARLITKLHEARDTAEEANKAKTDFLSSMSHEIRTPLNAIVGFGQALAKEDISGTAKEEVQDILMASNTLLEIVNGILDISKIEANKIEIVENEYSTKKMVSEITSLINARIGSKPIDFKILVDENLPPMLYGDNMRVKQVTINLLTNAVKYTQEGRILFQIKADNDTVNDICKLTISVQDTGMGMTEEDIDHLFTKYQRFDMEKNVNVEGTGLGMAITKSLVELMGGEINVKSTYGEGSTFIITLNQKIIHKEDQTEVVEDKQVKAFNASGSKVLVVDDNKINLKVAERLLREYNISVETVQSGSESIDKILDGKVYDLIFMDIMMPKMNGIETLENLKNIVGFKMPVVALTADVISGMEEKYIKEGFDDCLAKPIVEEELYYMLRKFLKESEGNNVIIEEKPATNEKNSVELLEENRINVKAGLELLKDMEMYNITLEEFYNELQNKITDLTNFKDSNNMEDYAILAHALKTEARYVGCNELGDIAYEHELAGKENNQALVNEKFDELKNEANRVYEVVKRYLGE